ncbi:MAG: response regulator [Candidatus Omnitrophica bacterium]|nr:response regulator [Candidatus Omnitrophota bacterium]
MTDELAKFNKKILIVDDDKAVRDFLRIFLEKKGFLNITQAASAEQALITLAQESDIKLVLLDIMLPDANGLDLLPKIFGIIKDIGIIMITGYPDEERAKKALKLGAYDYIIKPFDLAYLELSLNTKLIKMI